jgi:hypothetical protein
MKYIKNYALLGSRKECVQFIGSLDYIMGPGELKIKYIFDHAKLLADNYNCIIDLSSYYKIRVA